MARYQLLLLAAVLLLFFAAPTALAQQGRGRGTRMYDTKTEATLTGTVEAVQELAPAQGRGGMGGLHLTLKTVTESIDVHVGPLMYLHEKGLRIEKGDQLEILGSRITMDGTPVLIARQIKKDGETVTLRDESGRPMWAGGPGRQSR